MSLGTTIRELRKNKNWTQGQLQIASGLGRSYISIIELDRVDNPSADKLLRLARALDVDEDVLFESAGIKINPKDYDSDRELQLMFSLLVQIPKGRRAELKSYMRFVITDSAVPNEYPQVTIDEFEQERTQLLEGDINASNRKWTETDGGSSDDKSEQEDE